MKLRLIAVAALLAAGGCHRSRQITSLERKEAANEVSEAQFAMTLKDWNRAEGLFVQATQLCPDNGDFWTGLGMVRVHLGKRGDGKSAYASALSCYEDDAGRNPKSAQPILQQIFVLALMGRTDEAGRVLEKGRRNLPDDRDLRIFDESHQLAHLLDDAALKEAAL